MRGVLLAVVGLGFLAVAYLALLVNAASLAVIGVYIGASLLAWILSIVEKPWAARIKWAWIAVSLVVIYAVVTGPLDYLRMP